MDSQIPPQGNENQNQPTGFVTKPVEQPMIDSEIRQKIAPETVRGGGFRKFYGENKLYIWAGVAGLVIIGVLSFFAFRKQQVFAPKEANLSLSFEDTSDTVPAGGTVIYHIHIQNNDSQKLVNAQLELVYPDGFSFVSSSSPGRPANLSGTLFDEPALVPGQNVVTIVQAKATGNVNDSKSLTVKLHYKYSNFNSDFVKEAQVAVRLVASDISMDFNGPGSTNNAQLVIYTLNYRNNSSEDIKNARMVISFPDGFSVSSTNPMPDLGGDTWTLPVLPSGGNGTIEVQGTYRAAGAGESKTISAQLKVLGADGQYYNQADTSLPTAIANLPLVVSQELAENSSGNIVKPGGQLQFNISYQNTANTAASAVNVVATINSKAADLSTLQAEGGQISGNTILWNAASIPSMQSLAPNESGTLSFSVTLKNPATRDSATNLTVVSSIKIKSNEYEAPFPGNDLTLKISSPAGVSAALKFVNGQLPPQVGKTSTYKVSLSLTNSTNDFSNGTLTASLPLGANGFVAGSVTGGEASKVNYDPATGRLTWNFGNLPAHTGQFSQAKTLEFQVRIIPSSNQVSQSPVLVKDIAVSAKDTFTGEDINLAADDVNTAGLSGQDGFSNGQVLQ